MSGGSGSGNFDNGPAAEEAGSLTAPYGNRRQPELYWRQIEQLKAAAVYMRLHRNRLGKRVQAVEVVKAVASSGAIAGWVVFKEVPFFWGSIIAAAQLLDALKGVFPFAKQHNSAANLTVALELLLIDAEDEWELIHMGKITDNAIIRRRTRLKKLQLEAEKKYFLEGFEPNKAVMALATEETNTYLTVTYQMEAGLERS